MTALTAERDTPARDGHRRSVAVAAGVRLYKGALAVLAAGFAQPCSEAVGLTGLGRVVENADNSGGPNGFIRVEVEAGVFRFDNSATDPVGADDIGKPAYGVDDQTVAAGSNNNARSVIGTVFDVDPDGVWVAF